MSNNFFLRHDDRFCFFFTDSFPRSYLHAHDYKLLDIFEDFSIEISKIAIEFGGTNNLFPTQMNIHSILRPYKLICPS